MRIAFYEIEDWEIPIIKKAFKKHQLTFSQKKLTKKNINKKAEIISLFIYSKINQEILNQLPNLKLITTRSTGFDHLDLKACQKRKITVCNVPTYGENTVAEHTFALILALSRKIIPSIERTRKGSFELENLRGFDLKGKTIGIIGCGNIGQHVARIAQGFEMNTLVFDVKKDKKLAQKLNFKYVSFDYLLKNSDIITLHVPLIPPTKQMINKNNINKIKKGAILINTARGGLIETEALVKALDKGILTAAGLDVLEEECAIKEERELLTNEFAKTCNLRTLLAQHILLEKENVIITPHNAFNSKEALQRILNTTIQNIKAFIARKPVNMVR